MATTTNEDKIVKDTLRLIDQGWDQLHSQSSTSSKRNVIFVLGGTGAGKSTVTQTVTHLRRLHSIQEAHGTGFVIVDEVEEGRGQTEARIGDPQVASKTFLPEYLTCDDDNNLVFVDCPGFNDNRGPQMDIAAMVLIKKISEQVDQARFLFVIPSSSVSYSNMNRNDFLLLCTHATSFVKSLDKMKDSMGLIVTKVNNCNPASGERIEDKTVIDETSSFLKEIKNHGATSNESKNFIQHLLRDPSKWALIHYPSTTGSLSQMDHFIKVRQQIREICKNKLVSVPVTSNDFSITLSSDSKYIIARKLIPHMKGVIDRIVTGLVTEMESAFITRFEAEIQGQRSSTLVTALKTLEENCEKLKQTDQGHYETTTLPVTSKVNMVSQWLQITLPEVKIAQLKKVEEQLHLFQLVTEETDPDRGSSVKITNSFNSLKTKLEELHKSTLKTLKENNVRTVEAGIKVQVCQIVNHFKENYELEFSNSLENGDEYGRQALEKLTNDFSKFERLESNGFRDDEKMSVTLKNIWLEMNSPMDRNSLTILEELEGELEVLLELTGQLRSSGGGGGNILGEIRQCLNNLRNDARDVVRNRKIIFVHEKIQQQTATLFVVLETRFFQDVFYPGMNMATMEAKRRALNAAHGNLQQLWGSFNGILEGIEKAFKIFEVGVPANEQDCLRNYEALLNFYDGFLGNSVPRPFQEWMAGLRQLQERVHEMVRLYEFLELAKGANPGSVEQGLLAADGDVDATISRFLDALKATSDIRRIVQQRARAEDKLVIQSIATYLENERIKFLQAQADIDSSSSSSCCHHHDEPPRGTPEISPAPPQPVPRDERLDGIIDALDLLSLPIRILTGRLFRN